MAWDPNDENSYAGLTKKASEYGGVESFINSIEENAKLEAHIEDLKKFSISIPIALILVFLGKSAYDKLKQKYQDYNELKRKSNFAKETIKNNSYIIDETQINETNSNEEENL